MSQITSSGKWASALLIATALIAAIACGSDHHTSGRGGGAGQGGGDSIGGAATGGAFGGEATGGDSAGSEAGGAGAGSGAGGAAGATTTIDFSQHRLYQHLIEPFHTLEDCLAAENPDFFINCYQEVDFCPDGTVAMLVTDIQNEGSYVVGDGYIDTSFQQSTELPDEIRFEILSSKHLVDDVAHIDWLLAEDASWTYCP